MRFYTSKGYTMSQDTFRKAMSFVDVDPGFPDDLKPYMQEQAEILLRGEEDRRHPGLEQGAAAGLHGEGEGGGVVTALARVMPGLVPGIPLRKALGRP